MSANNNHIPQHVAIIMDGNGRWAKDRGEERTAGHKSGVQPIRDVVEAAAEVGVKYLTLYAFSTENWNRPQEEVNALMALLVDAIEKETKKLHENGVKLNAIGDISSLTQEVQHKLHEAMQLTAGNTGLTLTLALSYSARWEIIRAVKMCCSQATQGLLNINDISEDSFRSYLTTADMPDPELLIRTSGEQRISNFLLWQLAYTELYFTSTYWPDFGKQDFLAAISSYQQRERRFGKTSEQL